MKNFALFILFGLSYSGNGVLGKDDTYDVAFNGEYYWELLFDIDNSKNAGSIKREVTVTTEISCSYESMLRFLESSATSSSMSTKLSGTLYSVVNVEVSGSISHEVKSEYERMSKTKNDFRNTTTKVDTYEIGPNSRLTLYRLGFKGPGVSYLTDTLASSPVDRPPVPINIRVKQRYVLKDIQVVYTNDSIGRPNNLIVEAQGQNPDINAGFGGDFVWLVPVWVKNIDEGATGVQIAFQTMENTKYRNLANGAGGDYRYIKMLEEPNSKYRITEIVLWRSTSSDELPTTIGFYQFMTENINQYRSGDYLRLAWNAPMIR